MAIESAIGGANVTTTIEGRQRYPVNIRLSACVSIRRRHPSAGLHPRVERPVRLHATRDGAAALGTALQHERRRLGRHHRFGRR